MDVEIELFVTLPPTHLARDPKRCNNCGTRLSVEHPSDPECLAFTLSKQTFDRSIRATPCTQFIPRGFYRLMPQVLFSQRGVCYKPIFACRPQEYLMLFPGSCQMSPGNLRRLLAFVRAKSKVCTNTSFDANRTSCSWEHRLSKIVFAWICVLGIMSMAFRKMEGDHQQLWLTLSGHRKESSCFKLGWFIDRGACMFFGRTPHTATRGR